MTAGHRAGIGMTSLRTRDRLLTRLQEKGISDFHVLAAMRDVPRHLFVDEALASRAYEDIALPIGFGQTLSQPFVVARMTEALIRGVHRGRVLEIGTGCGYQSAILGQLFEQVFTVERVDALRRSARERFRDLGIPNVQTRHGDGYRGWPEHAPFDAIVLCAAPEDVPQALLDQLTDGARLVAPVGDSRSQRLVSIERDGATLHRRELDAVAFVPMLQGLA